MFKLISKCSSKGILVNQIFWNNIDAKCNNKIFIHSAYTTHNRACSSPSHLTILEISESRYNCTPRRLRKTRTVPRVRGRSAQLIYLLQWVIVFLVGINNVLNSIIVLFFTYKKTNSLLCRVWIRLSGICTPNQKLACFLLFLKINNTWIMHLTVNCPRDLKKALRFK